ncbi:sulfite exporter TauE/SafE family protein [Sulfurimonas sp. HSL3-7]|uniref:sulfite exporter TauE/SafE family protein n=1 Tax=Sulfonitrofixus jiaomeiensis TaxID=3131938 RepID=UPI0031F7A76A
MESVDLWTIFFVALLGSVGHCIGMCGGFVVAYSTAKIDPNRTKFFQSLAHTLYSVGRVVSYMLIGAVFGYLGSAINFSLGAKGVLFIVIGILMVIIAFSLSGKIKFLTVIEHSIVQTPLFKKLFQSVIKSKSLPSFFYMGVLNGLIPCGLVYFFATAAIASGSALMGAVVMAVFGLATVPALFILGMVSTFISQMAWRKHVLSAAAVLIALYGIYTGYKGYLMINHPEMIKEKMMKMKQDFKSEIEKTKQ